MNCERKDMSLTGEPPGKAETPAHQVRLPTPAAPIHYRVTQNPEPLRLEVGEFYARLVKGMLKPRGGQNGTDPAAPAPVFSTLKPWLDKIKNPALACMTAQTVAAGMCR